jgi:hypothetical protein
MSHPSRFQGGIDWWVSHLVNERAVNGFGIGLYWKLVYRHKARPDPGLYLCPFELLEKAVEHEINLMHREVSVAECVRGIETPECLPLAPDNPFSIRLYDSRTSTSRRCKRPNGTD